jgi:nicotinate-nucleotide adenylyltransferase
MEKERIGLFGGTFNPIHLGHLKAAKIVKKRFFLERVFFIPSYIPPHKDSAGVVSADHRLKMVELALRSYSCFVPCSIEVEAREKSYSIITLNKLKKLHPKALAFFILGVDAFLEIKTWKDYEQVLEQCYFVVIDRPGYRLDDAGAVLKGKYKENMHKLSASEAVRDELLFSFKIFLLPLDSLDLASTEIRERIRKGKSIKDMVSEEVEAYIKENKLYQT